MYVDSFTLPPRGEKPNNYPSLYISFVLLQKKKKYIYIINFSLFVLITNDVHYHSQIENTFYVLI